MVDERPFSESVNEWLARLQKGDLAAAQPLWERYFLRLAELASHRLRGAAGRLADAEDVALSAFDSFCRGAAQGRFPQLDRDGLWRLLVVITARKALKAIRNERRQKRGGGAVLDEAALQETPEDAGLEQVLGREPSPEFAAQAAEECRRLLDLLDDGELQNVALWKMEGCTNAEVAARLGCAPRSVERMLRLIRTIWAKELAI